MFIETLEVTKTVYTVRVPQFNQPIRVKTNLLNSLAACAIDPFDSYDWAVGDSKKLEVSPRLLSTWVDVFLRSEGLEAVLRKTN